MAKLIGNEVAGNPATSLVYKATHDGDGKSLEYMQRSFISFSYGGKNIEDFDLIVVINGDRMERGAYAEFNDITSESDIIEGQIYWSTHYNANVLDLTLATDGIEERTLDDFRAWFIPGKSRELVLAEHPNRGIMARIASVPELHLLPFEKSVTVKMGGRSYETKTTQYKGEISLSFIMDDPHWYSIQNILCYDVSDDDNVEIDYDKWEDANGEPVNIYSSQDALKIIKEDGTPTVAMIQPEILFGNNFYAYSTEQQEVGTGNEPSSDTTIARVSTNESSPQGIVGIVLSTTDGVTISNTGNKQAYLYYPGTATCYPKISFQLAPRFRVSEEHQDTMIGFITQPANSITNVLVPYNTINIKKNGVDSTLKLTLPSIWRGFNEVVQICKRMASSDIAEVKIAIRDGVTHAAPRAYALWLLNKQETFDNEELINKMYGFLGVDNIPTSDEERMAAIALPATFEIDCKTGKAIGKFTYRKFQLNKNKQEEQIDVTVEENVGDMIYSNHLKIEGQDKPSKNGYIIKSVCHKIWTGLKNDVENLIIEYKPMYL